MNSIKVIQIEQIDAQTFFTQIQSILEALNKIESNQSPQESILAKEDETVLTRRQVAVLLQVNVNTISTWVKKGLLPSHRIGNYIRFKKSEVYQSLKLIKPNSVP